jgi:hypothetical protein
MCGACGGLPPDWSVPLVSGAQRRAAIAALLTEICHGITVRPTPQGWTLMSSTGAGRVASTLGQLLDAAAGRLACTSWPELAEAVSRRSGILGAEPYGDYRPPPADRPLVPVPVPVLPGPGDLHLRLAAFGLGIRGFDRRAVALDALDRPAPFRLVAVQGRVIGAVDVPGVFGAPAAHASDGTGSPV